MRRCSRASSNWARKKKRERKRERAFDPESLESLLPERKRERRCGRIGASERASFFSFTFFLSLSVSGFPLSSTPSRERARVSTVAASTDRSLSSSPAQIGIYESECIPQRERRSLALQIDGLWRSEKGPFSSSRSLSPNSNNASLPVLHGQGTQRRIARSSGECRSPVGDGAMALVVVGVVAIVAVGRSRRRPSHCCCVAVVGGSFSSSPSPPL